MRVSILCGFWSVLIVLLGCDGKHPIPPMTEPEIVATEARWSPQGNIIALEWNGNSDVRPRGIYLLDTLDWSIKPLIIDSSWGAVFGAPAWSPDGEWLAFAYNTQLYKIKVNGDSLTQLTSSQRQWKCDWSRSDTLIAFVVSLGDRRGLWTMSTSGEDPRLLVPYVDYMAFGRADSILHIDPLGADSDSCHMWLVNPVDSGLREVMGWIPGSPFRFYTDPDYDFTRDRIAISIEGQIWTLTAEGEDLRKISSKGYSPSWSPDGTSIACTKPTVKGGEIWIMNDDGTHQRIVASWPTPAEYQQ